jgi:hypothetical protein
MLAAKALRWPRKLTSSSSDNEEIRKQERMTRDLQNASLSHAAMEKLAARVARKFTALCAKLKEMRPEIEMVQGWYQSHPRGSTSLQGCATFKAFCEKRLRRDESTVYRMLGNHGAMRKAKRADARRRLLDAHANAELPDALDIRNCGMEQLLAGVRGITLICTDPPYSPATPWAELARLAAIALHPGGILAVMMGQAHLPDVLDQMRQHLRYRWTLSYMTPGPSARIWSERINVGWKPVVLFGAVQERWMSDVAHSNRVAKELHNWQQSVGGMAQIIESLTSTGDLVCDPFCGSGTTLAAAAMLGRRVVGCDVDDEQVQIARARTVQALQVVRCQRVELRLPDEQAKDAA